MANYSRAFIFHKETDLMPYFDTIKEKIGYNPDFPSHQRTKARYEAKRDVQLIALLRWEEVPNNKMGGMTARQRCMCRIKCPINPIPVIGEFEIPSPYHICEFLRELGWTLEREHNLNLFK
jgi:hypothetical protein